MTRITLDRRSFTATFQQSQTSTTHDNNNILKAKSNLGKKREERLFVHIFYAIQAVFSGRTMGQAGSKPFEGKVIQTLAGHSREVLHCQFNNDGEILATCSADKTVILWTVATGEPLRTLKAHASEVTCCCFYDNILATASTDKTVILWLHGSGRRASKLGKRS